MHADILDALLSSRDLASGEQLAAFVRAHPFTTDHIQWLKDRSAQHYVTNPAEAVRIAQVAYDLSHYIPAPAPALGQWTLANAFFYTSRYVEAAQLYAQARSTYLASGHELEAARMGVGQVFVLGYTGQPEEALALAHEIEPILALSGQEDKADLRRLGGLLLNIAVVYDVLGEYEEALAVLQRQLPVVTQLGDQRLMARLKHNEAYALAQIGTYEEAIAAYQEAETLFSATEDMVDLARLYLNYATLLTSLTRYSEAREIFTRTNSLLTNLSGVDQLRHYFTVHQTQMYLADHTSIQQKTLDALAEAQMAAATHGPIFFEGLTWTVLGRSHLARGDLNAAQSAFTYALGLARHSADRSLEFRAHHGLGQLASSRGAITSAIEQYEVAIRVLESIRHDLHVDTFRADFLADRLVVYQDLVQLHIAAGDLEDAFAVVERAKSRLIAEKLFFRLTAEAEQLTQTVDDGTRTLSQQLRATLHQLDKLYQQAQLMRLRSPDEPAIDADTMAAIATLEQDVQSLTRQIQRQQPSFSPFATGEAVALADICKQLDGAFLLQYHVLREKIALFVVDQDGICSHHILSPLVDVDQARRAFNTAVERLLELTVQFGPQRAVRYLPGLLADAERHLYTLYSLLIEPWASLIPPGTRLIVSPDGPLHYIPFHALYDGESYLLEHHEISYTPSATVLELCNRPMTNHPARDQREVLLVGYDDGRLGSVSTEIATLAAFFPKASMLVDTAAQTESFLAMAEHHHLLHLATHARFRIDNPMLSAIFLADRRLTLAEIAALRLNADLVTLSGCETGRGQLRGTELLSLAGGFLGAGARSLLVSLWRVEDQATAHMMEHVYRALQTGSTRADALCAAQRTLLNRGRQSTGPDSLYRHPAYWAPFVLVGNWHPLSDGVFTNVP